MDIETRLKELRKRSLQNSKERYQFYEGYSVRVGSEGEFEAEKNRLENEKAAILTELEFISGGVELEAGWYQDEEGDLYRYDGVVWDSVPNGSLKKLEYLGHA